MKRTIFVLVFILLATVVFAQVQTLIYGERVYSSNGNLYTVGLAYYEEKYGGQQWAQKVDKNEYERLSFISNEQFEMINKILGRYQKNVGDTFGVVLSTNTGTAYSIICEMTSNTQYKWWAFRYKN